MLTDECDEVLSAGGARPEGSSELVLAEISFKRLVVAFAG